jgi:hypothetical protein
MRQLRNAYKILLRKPKEKPPFGCPKIKWDDNIKMDVNKIGYRHVSLIQLPQERICL